MADPVSDPAWPAKCAGSGRNPDSPHRVHTVMPIGYTDSTRARQSDGPGPRADASCGIAAGNAAPDVMDK